MGVGLEPKAVAASPEGVAAPAGVAEVVEDVVAPHAVLLELHPLPRVGMLVPAPQGRPTDAVAGAPVVVAGAAVVPAVHLEPLAVGGDPPALAAEAVVAGHPGEGPGPDEQPTADQAVHRPLGVEPREVEGGAELVLLQRQSPLAERLDELEVERAHGHVHPVEAQLPVGPHRGVLAPHVDDGKGLRRTQVGIDAHPRHHQQITGGVVAGEPHPLVGLHVRGPHDPHRVGVVVDQELVQTRHGVVLDGGVEGGAQRDHPGTAGRPGPVSCSGWARTASGGRGPSIEPPTNSLGQLRTSRPPWHRVVDRPAAS